MIENELSTKEKQVVATARAMMAAARTAPKGKGFDQLEIITVYGDEMRDLAEEMRRYAEVSGHNFFLRDAQNVEEAQAAVIIGTPYRVFGLNCGFCGFATCAEKTNDEVPCVINTNDLGIAIGSAVSVAADHRIDSRVMYSVGRAALDLGLLGECRAAFGILLSCSGKSPFFDRVSHKQ